MKDNLCKYGIKRLNREFYTGLIGFAHRINPFYTSEIIFNQLEAKAFRGKLDEMSKKII